MSHFSKIKTNITDVSALVKTISQLGFDYKLLDKDSNFLSIDDYANSFSISVYQKNKFSDSIPDFNFVWNGEEYIMMADVQLWSLDIDFNYFIDRLFQQYAYNMVVSTGSISGFNQIQQELSYDGSIRITLQKWNSI